MDKNDVITSNYNKLQDLLNSQESIMQKLGVLQVDLFNHPDSKLEKELEEISRFASQTYNRIKQVCESYQMDHNLSVESFIE